MKPKPGTTTETILLGIEGGGTRCVALAVNESGRVLRRLELGPANLRLLSDAQLVGQFKSIAAQMPAPSKLAIGLAGARTKTDRARIRAAAQKVWPGKSCYATHDLETGLMAARPIPGAAARILVLSGTGSCCFGANKEGRIVRIDGVGHILGDKGSGYAISLRALQSVLHHYDVAGQWPGLGARLLRALQFNEPDDLITWVQNVSKGEIAALAVEVFAAADEGDKIARGIVARTAEILAQDAIACANRLVGRKQMVQFVLAGSVLLKQPAFAEQVKRKLRQLWPAAVVAPLDRESVWGAVELARAERGLGGILALDQSEKPTSAKANETSPSAVAAPPADLQRLVSSPTEQRNPRSLNLDRLSLKDAIRLMLSEEANSPAAVLREQNQVEKAIQLAVRAFKRGGRLFYVGAGTSGRLGVLDASECPPTFNTDPTMVQGIMAGGQRALWDSVEGAEDDAEAGTGAIAFRAVNARDVVLGIAASGRTPFVWGALGEAKRRGAATVLLTFNPTLQIPRERRPTVVIAPNAGPEVLTGSTRLKAGTATKLVLNTITTLAMVRLGKVKSNLMIDVKASNAKLQDRATRILQQLVPVEYGVARTALAWNGWNIQEAWKALKANGE